MQKLIITWPTGCGKTYFAITEAMKLGKFIYLAPCRQLVNESWATYSLSDDVLSTGEIHLWDFEKHQNIFGVFESANNMEIKKYNTLIVDEAHFITDKERWGNLLKIIREAQNLGLNVFLLTATVNFKLTGFELKKLPARAKIKRKYKTLSNIDGADDFKELRKEKFLSFCSSRRDAEEEAEIYKYLGFKVKALHSDLTPSQRLNIQRRFALWELDGVCCTNILAQWINFPASVIIIPETDYNGETHEPEIFKQILGRVGRPGWSNKATIYYSGFAKKNKIKNKKIEAKIEEKKVETPRRFSQFSEQEKFARTRILKKIIKENKIDINGADWSINNLILGIKMREYKDIKYSISLIKAINKSEKYKRYFEIDDYLQIIKKEEEKMITQLNLFREDFNIWNKQKKAT